MYVCPGALQEEACRAEYKKTENEKGRIDFMDWLVLICGLLYNVVIIVVVTVVLKVNAKKKGLSEDFIFSSRNLPAVVVGATVALTGIGGGHINGLTAQAWGTGYATLWYCLAHGMAFCLMLVIIAPWFRRMGFTTIPDCFKKMFGPAVGVIVTGCTVGIMTGAIILETQGLGGIIQSATGMTIMLSTVLGVIIGVLYVVLAGMKEVGWVNLINAVLMYVFGIVFLVYVGLNYPGGWKGISDTIISSGNERLLHTFGDWTTVRTYIIGCIIACIFSISFSQQGIQPAFACRNIKTLKNALWTAVPVNCCFGVIVLSLGLASMAYPDAAATGAGNSGTFYLMLHAVPSWVSICVIGVFLAAVLSTFAMASLGCATVIVTNIQTPFYTKDRYMTPRKQANWCRFWILLVSVIAIGVSGWAGDKMNAVVLWMMSFYIPMFFIWFLGMFWRRSKAAAVVSLLGSWAVNCVLTLTGLAAVFKLEGNNYSIFMFVISALLYFVTGLFDRNSRCAYKKLYKEQHARYIEKMAERT